MITAVDTNVLSTLWAGEDSSEEAGALLREANTVGSLVVSAVVFAECIAHPTLADGKIEQFFREADMQIQFDLDEEVWRECGRRFAEYAKRRRQSAGGEPRRVLADFIIGSHALLRADRLLTFDTGHYRSSFPDLKLVSWGAK